MKTQLLAAALVLTSVPAMAFTTICGVRLPDDRLIKLSIEVTQEDEFSDPTIKTINGKKPGMITEKGAARFGYKGYESIELDLTDKCKGTAEFRYYDATKPMNPMRDITLKCVCP